MAQFLSKQKTRLGPRGGDWSVTLRPGVRQHVPDEDVERLLAWGKAGGKRLERAGLLLVIREADEARPPAPPKAEGEAGFANPLADEIPDTLAEVSVRKARPLIAAVEDLEVIERWAQVEDAGEGRAGIMDPLRKRYVELGGTGLDDEAEADEGEAGSGEDGSEEE